MTQFADLADLRAVGPPARRGAPIVFLCVLAFAYAAIALPLTLGPGVGSRNVLGSPAGNDFLAFYSTALLAWRNSAADVFDLSRLLPFQDALSGTPTHLPFAYPPHFLLFIAPLAALPYLPALYLWIAATAAPFVLIARNLSGLALPIVALAPPLVQNAIDGQNGALTASAFAGGLVLLSRRPALAGIVFALLSFKPQVFALIPICLLAARQYRAFVWLVAASAALVLVSVATFGLEVWLKFLAFLPQQMAFVVGGRLPVGRCPTVFMLALHTTGNLALAYVAQACATLAAWALVGWTWRRTDGVFARALSFCVAMPLSTPYLLEYDLAVWALPASMLLTRLWRGGGRGPDWLALPVLWATPPLIWLLSLAGLHFSALAVIALAPYVVWSVLHEPGEADPAARSLALASA